MNYQAIDLGRDHQERLRIVQYHLSPAAHLDEEMRMAALDTLARGRGMTYNGTLSVLADLLGLRVACGRVQLLHRLTLTGCTPTLTFVAFAQAEAERDALVYLRRALEHDPVPSRPKPIRSL